MDPERRELEALGWRIVKETGNGYVCERADNFGRKAILWSLKRRRAVPVFAPAVTPAPARSAAPTRWSVRVSQRARGRLLDVAASAYAREEGGGCFGKLDHKRREILVEEIVSATRPGATSSGCEIDFRRLESLRMGRQLVGTWHSHPGEDPLPSWTDRRGLGVLAQLRDHPVAEVIVSANRQVSAHVASSGEPRSRNASIVVPPVWYLDPIL